MKRLTAALVGTLVLCATTATVKAAPVLGPLTVLSVRSKDNRSAAVASTPHGERLFAVWDGVVEGHRRIIFRERLEGEWLPEVILDADPAAHPNTPAVASDATGNPWVTWRAMVEGRFQPFVACRIAGHWIRWLPAEAASWPKGDAEEVSVAVTENGMACIAWHEAIGAGYSIRAAYLAPEAGVWVTSELSAASEGYGLYPAIVLSGATATVVWYRANAADFTLVERPIGPAAGEQSAAVVPGLEAMPANRFPAILRDSSGRLAGLWYDEIGFTDRILLGTQGAPSNGAGVIVDQRPDAENREVAGSVLPARFAIAWVAESPGHGTEIMAGFGVQPPFEQISVSAGERDWFARPAAAPLHGGAVVVWESSAEFGGSGDILFREVRLTSEPASLLPAP